MLPLAQEGRKGLVPGLPVATRIHRRDQTLSSAHTQGLAHPKQASVLPHLLCSSFLIGNELSGGSCSEASVTLQGHCFWDSSKPGAAENKHGDTSAANLIGGKEISTVETLHKGKTHIPGLGGGKGWDGSLLR